MPVTVPQYSEARTTLGAAFGTKKAKAAIRARERNRVDVDAMQGVAGHLQSTIEESTINLPTQGVPGISSAQPLLTTLI
jgi:DNA-directed RNA polymerase I subunit RPA49